MVRILSVAVVALLAATSLPALSKEAVTTPRGDTIEVQRDYPSGAGPFPVLILASGQGRYEPVKLLDAVTAAAVAKGIAVYRFNWAFVVRGGGVGNQSKDRAAEIEDYKTVANLAVNDPKIDPTRVAAAGKSLGSIIGWRVLRDVPNIKALVALTPVCSTRSTTSATFADNYVDLPRETRPSLWLLGDQDSACEPRTLYGLLTAAGGPVRVAVLSGDHGLGLPGDSKAANAERDARTLALAGAIVADYLAGVLGGATAQ